MTKRYEELLKKFGEEGLTRAEQTEFHVECRITDAIEALTHSLKILKDYENRETEGEERTCENWNDGRCDYQGIFAPKDEPREEVSRTKGDKIE